MKIKNIPNMISCIRIICSIALLFTEVLSSAFYLFYIICGVSDALDGYIARKTKSESKFGAVLDSIADALFIGIIIIVFLPIFRWSRWMLFLIGAIAVVRFISLGIGFYKFHTSAFLHTYANKAAGFVIFLIPVICHLLGFPITVILVCIPAGISAVEDLLINSTSKQLDRNVKGILRK